MSEDLSADNTQVDLDSATAEPKATPEPEAAAPDQRDADQVARDLADARRDADLLREEVETHRADLAARDQANAELRRALLVRDASELTGIPANILAETTAQSTEEFEAHAAALREWAEALAKAGVPKRPTHRPTSPFQSSVFDPQNKRVQAVSALRGES